MLQQGPRRSTRLAKKLLQAIGPYQPSAGDGAAAQSAKSCSSRPSDLLADSLTEDTTGVQKMPMAAATPDAEPADDLKQQPRKRPRGRPKKAAEAAAAAAPPAAVNTAVDTAARATADAADAAKASGADQLRSQKQQRLASSTSGASSSSSSRAKPKPAKGKSAAAAASGPTRAAEQKLWNEGLKLVAGVDEAGRGPLAGPVVAAAAILPQDADFPQLNDSKKMTEEQREEVYQALTTHPGVHWAVSVVDHDVIDEINILQAAMLAMTQAVQGLGQQPDYLLIDGNRQPPGLSHMPLQLLVKGDATSTCIAAASVIAKVTRDRLMLQLDKQYPQYGFAQHKGYGVPSHRAAILQQGPCDIHRRSFEPVKSMTGWAGYGQKAKAAAAAATGSAAAAGGSRSLMCMA